MKGGSRHAEAREHVNSDRAQAKMGKWPPRDINNDVIGYTPDQQMLVTTCIGLQAMVMDSVCNGEYSLFYGVYLSPTPIISLRDQFGVSKREEKEIIQLHEPSWPSTPWTYSVASQVLRPIAYAITSCVTDVRNQLQQLCYLYHKLKTRYVHVHPPWSSAQWPRRNNMQTLRKLKSKLTSSDKPGTEPRPACDTMANERPTVAIFGASGHLGMHICHAFLQDNMRKNFKAIILFTRQSSKQPQHFGEWEDKGWITIRQIATETTELADQLADIDIIVNTIGSEGNALRTQIVHAAAKSNVKLYFPSEFGVDHTIHDFSHPEWDKKKAHFRLASEHLPRAKICRVYAGLFLEDSIGPWFGFDTKNGNYESYGSSEEKVTYTSLDDIGRAVASLASMSPDQIPAQVHLCGDIVSMRDVANVMRNKSGAGSEIRIVEENLERCKRKELAAGRPDPSGCLRFLMGEGKIKHATGSLGCDNELVNPGEIKWKWKTMSDLADETGGRPWAGATWS